MPNDYIFINYTISQNGETFYDLLLELDKIEVAKEMLIDGEAIEKIVKYSRLPLEKIEELKKELFSI